MTLSDFEQRQLDAKSTRSLDRLASQPAIAKGETPLPRFAVCYAASDGMRGPIEGSPIFSTREAAEREAARLHAAKPFISYGVIAL